MRKVIELSYIVNEKDLKFNFDMQSDSIGAISSLFCLC